MKKLRQTHDWQVAKDKKQKEFQWAMKYRYENEWLEKSFSSHSFSYLYLRQLKEQKTN